MHARAHVSGWRAARRRADYRFELSQWFACGLSIPFCASVCLLVGRALERRRWGVRRRGRSSEEAALAAAAAAAVAAV